MNKRKENKERIKAGIELQKREKRSNLGQMLRSGMITQKEYETKMELCK